MFARSKSREYWLLYRGEDGSEGICRFDQSNFAREEPDAIPRGARVFSATAEDMRMDHPKERVSLARLERIARQESGEGGRLRIVRMPKPASIWFTPASRMKGLQYYLFPLAATLENMLLASGRKKPALVGVLFGGEERPDLILFVAFREAEQAQVFPALHPESVEEATISALHDARLPEDTLVVLFRQADLWEACAKAKPYPLQEPFLGMDPVLASVGFAGVSVLSLAALVGYWKYQDMRYQKLQDEHAAAAAETDEIKKRIAGRLQANPEAVAATFREDWKRVLNEASALWREGGRIESEFANGQSSHWLIFPVRNTLEEETGWLSPEKILSLRSSALPQGCQMAQILLTGNGNEIKVQYLCSHPRTDLLGGGR